MLSDFLYFLIYTKIIAETEQILIVETEQTLVVNVDEATCI